MTASESAQASAVPASREARIRPDEAKLRPDFIPKDAYLSRCLAGPRIGN
jgi:hypothetical protein